MDNKSPNTSHNFMRDLYEATCKHYHDIEMDRKKKTEKKHTIIKNFVYNNTKKKNI